MGSTAMNQAEKVSRHSRLAAPLLLLSLLLLVSLLLIPGAARAATNPGLGTAASFGVLGATTVTNTGPTVVHGNVGVSPGKAVTGFPPGFVTPPGTIHRGDAVAAQAQSDGLVAYNNLAGQACDTVLTGQDLGGLTLTPGVYCFSSSAQLTGQVTLDAQGDPNAVFIFQIGSTLTSASNSSVLVINSTSPCNVFWQVGSSATLGTTTQFQGNILALTSITLTTGATIQGGLYALNGAVTLDTNTITVSACNTAAGTPTNTRTTRPTNTSAPPTNTRTTRPTNTSAPPTNTRTTRPTNTSAPPTNTSGPPTNTRTTGPTNTSGPPTNTRTTGPTSTAVAGKGILKICKALEYGTLAAPGTLFSFSVTGHAGNIDVAPGTCTALSIGAGAVTIQEQAQPNYEVSNIQFVAGTGTISLATASTVATVRTGLVTEVQFTNHTPNPPNTGYIEICKETDGGLTGTFSFTSPAFGGTQSISVVAGALQPVCGLPILVASGPIDVTELAASGTTLTSARTLPASNFAGLTGHTATVNVVAGGRENQTLIIFHNIRGVVNGTPTTTTTPTSTPSGGTGILKICKALLYGTLTAPDTLFNFTVAGQAGNISVAPGTCTELSTTVGSVSVQEQAQPYFVISSIQFIAGTGTTNAATASVVAEIQAGLVTEVQFTNRNPGPVGFIEICTETDGGLTGTFSFTSPAFGRTQSIRIVAGAPQPVCGPIILVAPGTIKVTELAASGTTLTSARTLPAYDFLGRTGRTATVKVVAGGPAQQTIVIFHNTHG